MSPLYITHDVCFILCGMKVLSPIMYSKFIYCLHALFSLCWDSDAQCLRNLSFTLKAQVFQSEDIFPKKKKNYALFSAYYIFQKEFTFHEHK